jgi:hypothetical protein
MPSAVSEAAISLGRARSRRYEPSTSGHTISSISSNDPRCEGRQVGHADRRRERHLHTAGHREAAAEGLLGAGDRAGHERRAGLERQPSGPAARVAEVVGVADSGALREERQQASPAEDDAGRFEGVLVGLAAPDRKAPSRTSSLP